MKILEFQIEKQVFSLNKESNFIDNKEIIRQISLIASKSYKNNVGVFEREINYCDEFFTITDSLGNLIAFFMVKFEKIDHINTYYLGWSSCDEKYKGLGLAKLLYNSFFISCNEYEIELNDKILCWWTTATPIAFSWFNHNIENCQPNKNGEISSQARNFYNVLRKNKYSDIDFKEEEPFILRNYASETLYSDKENDKLNLITTQLDYKIFKEFPINERNGDRYLMLGYVPNKELVNDRIAKILEKF